MFDDEEEQQAVTDRKWFVWCVRASRVVLAFVMDAVVCKANERKMFMHADFEAMCSKYWQLLRT